MKIIICNADTPVQEIEIKDKFVFILTKDGRVYHIDSSDGDMWLAKPDLSNLGAGHQSLIKKTKED